MTKTYTFSYYARVNKPYLLKKPWWKIWESDSIVFVEENTRICHLDITEEEAKIIIACSENYWHSTLGILLVRFLGKEPSLATLEENIQPSLYINTESN